MVAKTINSKNEDLAPLAIAGVTGDKQYIGGIRGLNKIILDEALKKGFLKQEISMKLYGESLYDALYYSIDPYYSGISGDEDGVYELLERLNLDKKASIKELDENLKKQLHSFLILKLIKKDCEKNILDTIIRTRYWSDMLHNEMERFSDLLDACGKGGNRGLGLSLCLGNKNAFDEAFILEKKYKQEILDELVKLEYKGFYDMKSFRYFYSKNSSLGGVIGGIAANFILDREKPLISIVRKNDEIHISCRGNQYLVNDGLDLGFAMKKAATELKGNGGGHKIAAGATISSDKEKEFLDIVDNIISNQIRL
jgi:RecJ-like exonuclease